MSEAADPALAEVLGRALDCARRSGASAADAVLVQVESSSSAVRLGEVETVKLSRERRLGLRCFAGQGSAVASTADLERASIEAFAADVVAMARVVVPDPTAGLPDAAALAADRPDLEIADWAGLELAPEERIARARRCEAAALAVDPRIVNSEGAELHVSASGVHYASSAGFAGDYRSTAYSLSVSPIAADDTGMQRDSWWDARRHLARLADPEEIGRIAARRALRRLGARPVATQEVPVVFDPQTAASLLGHLAAAVCGGAIYRKVSFLQDRIGEAIASPLVHVVDDGRLAAGLASRPFDAEGVATRRTTVVEAGILQSYLLDTYGARKLERHTTGNAARSVGDVPAAAPTNFHLLPGASTPDEIVAAVDRGLFVTSLSGFGVNGVTGDYSRGAAGLWIENGELTFPVEEITIAGNLLQMLHDIAMVGSDLELRSSISAPTLLVARMTVGGR